MSRFSDLVTSPLLSPSFDVLSLSSSMLEVTFSSNSASIRSKTDSTLFRKSVTSSASAKTQIIFFLEKTLCNLYWSFWEEVLISNFVWSESQFCTLIKNIILMAVWSNWPKTYSNLPTKPQTPDSVLSAYNFSGTQPNPRPWGRLDIVVFSFLVLDTWFYSFDQVVFDLKGIPPFCGGKLKKLKICNFCRFKL